MSADKTGMPALGGRLARNFSILFGGNVVGQLAYFAGLLYVARSLGPAAFGVWNLAQVIALYLLRAGDPGLEVESIRAIASDHAVTRQRLTTVITTRVWISAGLYLAILVATVAGFVPGDARAATLVFSLSLFPTAILAEWVFEAHQNVSVVSAARVLKGVLFLALAPLAVTFTHPDLMTAAAYVLSLAVPAVIFTGIAFRRFGRGDIRLALAEGPSLIARSWPFGVMSLLTQYCLFLGTVLCGYLVDRKELGFYTVAHRPVIFIWMYVVVSAHRVLLPSLAEMRRTSQQRAEGFIGQILRVSTLLIVPVGYAAGLLAPILLVLLFGPAYAGGTDVFRVLLVALVIAISRMILEVDLIARHEQHTYLHGVIGMAVVYSILTPIGIHVAGIMGCAWAAVAAEASFFVYLLVTADVGIRKALPVHLIKPVIALLPAGALLVFLPSLPVVVSLAAGLGTYLVVLVLLRGTGRDDVRLVRSIFSRGPAGPHRPSYPLGESGS